MSSNYYFKAYITFDGIDITIVLLIFVISPIDRIGCLVIITLKLI